MKKRITLGIDFGGTSSKAVLLDESGKVLASSSEEYPGYYPQNGWSELDVSDMERVMYLNIRSLLEKSGAGGEDICAVALDAATHMAVLTDENDKPLRRVIHWSDARSAQQAERIKREHDDLLKMHSCNAIGAAWTLPQLLWLRENEPEILPKTKRIYFLKDWLRHCLTGDFCTDSIEAMGAMLADDKTEEWADDLCALAGISPDMLPKICAPSDIAGEITVSAAEKTGLKAGTPVLVGTTDTVMEVYAAGAVEVGCATVKLATAGRICPITKAPIDSRQFFNYKHIIKGLWYPGTGTRACAASYRWYRDVFGDREKEIEDKTGESSYQLLDAAAEKVPAGSDGLFYHPYLLGEMTPYYDNLLRGSFVGATMHHTKGYFSRAVMEGVAYSMRDCLEEITSRNIEVKQFRVIGGGAKGPLWRQILSDVLDQPLVCTFANDSSLGSAMLAGVAAGMFCSYEDSVEKCVKISGKTEPDPANAAVYERGFNEYRDIQKALAEVYHKYP